MRLRRPRARKPDSERLVIDSLPRGGRKTILVAKARLLGMLDCGSNEVTHTPLAQFSADSLVTAFSSTVGSSHSNVPWECR